MKKASTHFVPESFQWDPKYPFDLVIAYEDNSTRDQAMLLYDRVAQQLMDDYDFQCSWWKFDYMRDARLMSQAVEEALEANMIILSLTAGHDLPLLAREWIENWVPLRQNNKSALVALLQMPENPDFSISALRSCLQQVAKQAQMDFFLHLVDANETAFHSIESLHQRAEQVTPLLEDILHTSPLPTLRLN